MNHVCLRVFSCSRHPCLPKQFPSAGISLRTIDSQFAWHSAYPPRLLMVQTFSKRSCRNNGEPVPLASHPGQEGPTQIAHNRHQLTNLSVDDEREARCRFCKARDVSQENRYCLLFVRAISDPRPKHGKGLLHLPPACPAS